MGKRRRNVLSGFKSRVGRIFRIGRFAMAGGEMHSVVALLEDLPDEGLVRGQVGTVVENWSPGVYEVEFADENGRTYAMVALKAEQLMVLHHDPAHQSVRKPAPYRWRPRGRLRAATVRERSST